METPEGAQKWGTAPRTRPCTLEQRHRRPLSKRVSKQRSFFPCFSASFMRASSSVSIMFLRRTKRWCKGATVRCLSRLSRLSATGKQERVVRAAIWSHTGAKFCFLPRRQVVLQWQRDTAQKKGQLSLTRFSMFFFAPNASSPLTHYL